MPEVSPETFDTKLSQSDPFVVDIRPEAEFEDWKIPESTNIDVYEELHDHPERAKRALATVPEGEEIITVCAAGVMSEKATAILGDMGYDAKTLEDGLAGWSRVHRSGPVDLNIDGTLVQVTRPGKGCLSYVLISQGDAVVFDPSHYREEYESILDDYSAELIGVYDTHAHADHVSGGQRLAKRHDVPYHLHPADARQVTATPITDGEMVTVGTTEITIQHTPGHSPGGVTYSIEEAALLTGDTLFHNSVGRVELGVEAGLEETDVEENAAALYESPQRLVDHDGNPLILPAHDPGTPYPPVSAHLEDVRAENEDLQLSRTAFIDQLSSDIPDHPPNFDRVKRVNVGVESVPESELAEIELGPNNCAVKE